MVAKKDRHAHTNTRRNVRLVLGTPTGARTYDDDGDCESRATRANKTRAILFCLSTSCAIDFTVVRQRAGRRLLVATAVRKLERTQAYGSLSLATSDVPGDEPCGE